MPVSFYLAFPSVPCVSKVGYFCCTFPEVSLGGRYPLSRPSMPGLSSHQYLSATWRAAAPPACLIIAEWSAFVKVVGVGGRHFTKVQNFHAAARWGRGRGHFGKCGNGMCPDGQCPQPISALI